MLQQFWLIYQMLLFLLSCCILKKDNLGLLSPLNFWSFLLLAHLLYPAPLPGITILLILLVAGEFADIGDEGVRVGSCLIPNNFSHGNLYQIFTVFSFQSSSFSQHVVPPCNWLFSSNPSYSNQWTSKIFMRSWKISFDKHMLLLQS